MWKYVGKEGEFIPAVPARDLSDEEAKAYPVVRESTLYQYVATDEPKAARKVRKSDG